MKIEQIYTGCLAQGAYYIESNGEVAIIDPLREVQPYIERAEKDGAKIKYILETHFHADFVSGHITLAEKTGATIVYGPTAEPNFNAHIATDGEELKLGNITIKVLHTPGHTMESTTYLLRDEKGKDQAIFTGDTLFLGDVGRPDLAQKAAHLTQEQLAATLYHSLRNKIMPLADDITVYPAHGAGSACGKNMMKETVDTLGNQKKMNYALRADMTEAEFVEEVTDGLLPPPSYFPLNVKMNKEGYTSIDNVLKRGLQQLTPDAFEAAANETGAIILDVRHQKDFVQAFVPNSIFIGLDGGFAPWVGALIADVEQPILLIAPEGREEEAITRLARVGFDNVLGYLKGGLESWKAAGKEIDTMASESAEDLEKAMKGDAIVIDVRKEGEYTSEHVENATNLPLDFINDHMSEFPKEETFHVHCAGGYRSVIAGSILKSRGIHNLINVEGGYGAIKKTGIPVTDYVCPTTLKN
ncbi:MBL fold metallo-hydrolase [Owenweeksia hongkongensis]|uniref:MBL fold metallo-hydrolase n=1 Tax=Owenweeksia hongkongensis TaxID=253245 RepID=UPI003A91CABC